MIPFVAIGLHLLFGRFMIEARQHAHTYYGIANHRVVIIISVQPRETWMNLITMLSARLGLIRPEVRASTSAHCPMSR